MQLGLIGLGRMGKNIALRAHQMGHDVVVYNRSRDKTDEAIKEGLRGVFSVEDLVKSLSPPRLIWVMVPAGDATENMVKELVGLVSKGDYIIDGGNSYFKEDMKRFEELKSKGIEYVDIGTSGGIIAAKIGYCLMVGGREEAFKHMEPLLKDISISDGYLYCGPSGSGHFVKMVHNAIEYGQMQAIGEGFELLEKGPYNDLKLDKIAHLWNHGSIVRSFLMELAEDALSKDPRLNKIGDYIDDTGEGRWAIQTAFEQNVPFLTAAHALFVRYHSRQDSSFSNKLIAALRNEFGGHAIKENK